MFAKYYIMINVRKIMMNCVRVQVNKNNVDTFGIESVNMFAFQFSQLLFHPSITFISILTYEKSMEFINRNYIPHMMDAFHRLKDSNSIKI